jgi:hypothetical protein
MPANKIKTPKFGFFGRHKITSAIILVTFLGIAGIFIYQKIALELNKCNFQHARTAIDSVYADIVRQVGPPDDYKVIDLCSRRYQEFTGYGNLTCHIDKSFIYGVGDEAESNNLFKKIQKNIDLNNEFRSTQMRATSITDTLVVSTDYHTASDKYKIGSLDCVVNYVFDTPREIDLSIKEQTKKPFEITIGCFGPARQPYYPLD